MIWLLVAITSYFINAGVYVADKFLLSKKIHSSIVYAFFVGIWSIFNIVLLIFDPWMPTIQEMFLDFGAGFLFLITLIFWYKALHQSEATRVVPIVGALVPIFSFFLSWTFLGETLNLLEIIAFIILISGGILISVKQTKFYIIKAIIDRVKNILGNIFGSISAEIRPTRRLIINSIISAFFFASYYVLMKHIYMAQPFIGSFVWSRFGTFIGVLLMLLVPTWRFKIIKQQKETRAPKNLSFFVIVRLFAAIAFIMLNWAISLGDVAMTNALQGTQYLFLIFLVLILSTRYPKILKEELGKGVLIQKIIGVILISIGIYLLVLPTIE